MGESIDESEDIECFNVFIKAKNVCFVTLLSDV